MVSDSGLMAESQLSEFQSVPGNRHHFPEAATPTIDIQHQSLNNIALLDNPVTQNVLVSYNRRSQYSCRFYLRLVFLVSLLVYAGEEGFHLHPSSSGRQSRKARTERGDRRQEPYKPPQGRQPDRAADRDEEKENKNKDNDATAGPSGQGTRVADENRFLACPYFKFNPLKYQSCFGLDLKNTSRVVQHLERTHSVLPIHCPTCGQTFKTREECDSHIYQRSCAPRPFEKDGMTAAQQRQLHENRRRMTQTDRWYSFWNILFPDAVRPDSPFVGEPIEEWLKVAWRVWLYLLSKSPNISSHEFFTHHTRKRNAKESSSENTETDLSILFDWTYLRPFVPLNQDDLSFLSSDQQVSSSDATMTSMDLWTDYTSRRVTIEPDLGNLATEFNPSVTSQVTDPLSSGMVIEGDCLARFDEDENSLWRTQFLENTAFATDWDSLTDGNLTSASLTDQFITQAHLESLVTDEFTHSIDPELEPSA
ncbi:hypothetical protein HJFPF1_10146 [Paramyrothecium foliicola]|nr:hypothetical protein HJFPF1_10146 [Paramyrothecium foliicola]